MRDSARRKDFKFEGEELERRFEWFLGLYRTKSGNMIIQVHDDCRVTISDLLNSSNATYTSESKLETFFKVGSDEEKEEAQRVAEDRQQEVAEFLDHPIVKEDLKKMKGGKK